jgi:hypothetical protein
VWGGPEEQANEIAAGNVDAKDWQDEAKQIVERTVCHFISLIHLNNQIRYTIQMAQYYRNRPRVSDVLAVDALAVDALAADLGIDNVAHAPVLSEFDKHRKQLLTDDAQEGWVSELRRYLSTMQEDVTKDTDLVEWW